MLDEADFAQADPMRGQAKGNLRARLHGRYWGFIEESGGKAIRVVTLEDGETIHNAFRR